MMLVLLNLLLLVSTLSASPDRFYLLKTKTLNENEDSEKINDDESTTVMNDGENNEDDENNVDDESTTIINDGENNEDDENNVDDESTTTMNDGENNEDKEIAIKEDDETATIMDAGEGNDYNENDREGLRVRAITELLREMTCGIASTCNIRIRIA